MNGFCRLHSPTVVADVIGCCPVALVQKPNTLSSFFSKPPCLSQKTVSSTLNIPRNKITCHVKRVGGGFGGKVGRPAVFGAIAAVGALK